MHVMGVFDEPKAGIPSQEPKPLNLMGNLEEISCWIFYGQTSFLVEAHDLFERPRHQKLQPGNPSSLGTMQMGPSHFRDALTLLYGLLLPPHKYE